MQNQKGNIVLIILGIVSVSILAGGVGYFVAKKPTQKEDRKQQINTYQQQQIQQEQQKSISEITQQKTDQPEIKDETADWKTYRNEKYGFEIILTDAWKEYKVTEQSVTPYNTNINNLRFYIPTTDKTWNVGSGWYDPMVISIYSKSEWEKTQKEEGPKPDYVLENEVYVFGYSRGHDIPRDFANINLEIPKIVSTFKFIK